MVERYTQVPRTTLWLVQEAEIELGGETVFVGSFYIGKSPITNLQYEAFAPGHPRSPVSPGDDDPVVGVSFTDALGYCEWYSRLSRKAFRLPTEVEWELACRGPTRGRWFFGDDPARADAYVWHRHNSGGRCHPVESTRCNPLGLHEMLGNVWEWTSSVLLPWPPRDGDGRDDLADLSRPRVLRGGSFRTPLAEMGADVRRAEAPDARLDDVGFRIVRSL